jgi:hypothetical protein
MPRRQDLNDFVSQHPDLVPVLVEQMKQFLTEDIILQHQNNMVIDHARLLLPDHRKYISIMEARFIEQGHPELVPIPKWDPATTIPEPFFEVVRVSEASLPILSNPMEGLLPPRIANTMDIDPDYNARNDRPRLPEKLRPPKLHDFDTRHDLEHYIGHMIGLNYHSECHAKLGGPMLNEYTTAGALIFWPLHAFLDDIYYDWQQRKPKVEIVRIQEDPPGADWQGEYVELLCHSYDAVDMTGWTLSDSVGHTFTFPTFSLRPEGVIRVWTGPGDDDVDNLHWGLRRTVWNNNRDEALLAEATGTHVDRYSYDRVLPW